MEVLNVDSLSKSYSGNQALSNFSISLNRGEVIALLGPNGAGKTTFVKSILGLLKADSGTIKFFDVESDSVSRSKVSYLPEKFTFYPYFTIEATLRFYADMYNIKSNRQEIIDNALRKLGILDIKGKKISDISKGQLQRVGLACVTMGSHEFIILDEPFSGLDPIGIKEVKDLCVDLKKSGKTLLINSHILAEMEKMADRVIILNKGKTLAFGSVDEVRGDMSLEDKFFKLVKDGEAHA
ncbi:ABC transporter ATP-binding protein [Bacteriovorax sp. Seq25_V]|uniref:ABC transporter ATP-binding protein n=1 Tax=Bacteriovorax sp. Seq25_V TaxID=1201288 RepID=UPI00038A3C86|nr:ABC transporter ATP-binding protein [Bacteriovorax sp. Seq25_V]EQC43877.1 hydrolase, P-loop-like family protein [Bacteriovorax sp. Seq25_V]